MTETNAEHTKCGNAERWLSVAGFEGYYEVSDRGRERNRQYRQNREGSVKS